MTVDMSGRCAFGAASIAAALALLVLTMSACSDGGGNDGSPTETPTTAATEEPVAVIVEMAPGCDQPEPDRGWEVLALVRVTYEDGRPVAFADVRGEAGGPAVALGAATDNTMDIGEALLLFAVTEPGTYTMTVTGVTLATGEEARFDPASTLSVTQDVGDACAVPPTYEPLTGG